MIGLTLIEQREKEKQETNRYRESVLAYRGEVLESLKKRCDKIDERWGRAGARLFEYEPTSRVLYTDRRNFYLKQ